MSFEIRPATPVDTHIRLALAGPAGSGKTVSALRLATGFGGKIVMIDTENKRALKYAKDFKFDHMDFQPPFNPARYQEAIAAAEKAGAATIIIDSMSHEHEGPGGVLEMADDYLNKKAGDDWKKREALKMSSWIIPKSQRTRLIQFGIQRVNANIILCFRAKDKIEIQKLENNAGKLVNTPVPIGLQPIGGEDFYYEMDVLAALPAGSKGKPDWTCPAARINDLEGSMIKALHATQQFTEETGKILRRLNSAGTPLPTKTEMRPHSDTSLEDAGDKAASEGMEVYRKWFEGLMNEQKQTIAHKHEGWKAKAKKSDDDEASAAKAGA